MSDTEHLVGHFCFHFLTMALSNITWLSMTLSRKYRVRRKLFYLAHPVSQPPTGREYRKTWKSVIQNKQPSWSPVAGHTEATGLKLPLWYSFPNRIHHCKSKSLHIPYPWVHSPNKIKNHVSGWVECPLSLSATVDTGKGLSTLLEKVSLSKKPSFLYHSLYFIVL